MYECVLVLFQWLCTCIEIAGVFTSSVIFSPSQLMCIWATVCVCVCVAGQLPGAILICQCNSLPRLIFNKAPREPRTSSSELSVCSGLLNKAHLFWRAGPGERKQPEYSCHESCQLLWTIGQFFVFFSQTLKCKEQMVGGLCLTWANPMCKKRQNN